MGLTPHEERQIHQIEETLLDSDPGFAERMNQLLRPRRKFIVAGLCLVVVVLGIVASQPPGAALSIGFASTAALVAGWCLGRVSADPRWWLRRLGTGIGRIVCRLCRVVALPAERLIRVVRSRNGRH